MKAAFHVAAADGEFQEEELGKPYDHRVVMRLFRYIGPYKGRAIATAIAEHGGLQCGFCTPGMVVTTHHLVNKAEIAATPEGMRQALGGNLCRCTGYANIIKAVQAVAEQSHS